MPTTLPLDGLVATLPPREVGDAAARILQALGAAVAPTNAATGKHIDDGSGRSTPALVATGGRRARERHLAAACGALGLTGKAGRPPRWPNAPVCSGLVGLVSAFALLARTLAPSDQPGTPPFEATRWLTYLLGIARARHETGVEPTRAGPRNPALMPVSPYPDTLLPCADGWVHAHYAPSDPALLTALTGTPGVEPIASGATAIDRALEQWLCSRTRTEAAAEAQSLRHPFVPVATLPELRGQYTGNLPAPVTQGPGTEGVALRVPPSGPPLAGVRVLELGVAVAGPMAGELLALLGADVTRITLPVALEPGWYDRLKGTAVADLGSAAGRATLRRRLGESDVFLTNLSARAQQNLNLVEAVKSAAAPGLISVAITAFAAGDERHLWGAFDAGIQAAVGLADATRYPGGGPLRVAGHPIDGATALVAACTVLAGVRQRRRTAQGLHAEVSMLGAGLLLMAPLLEGGGPQREASLDVEEGEPLPGLASVTQPAGAHDWLPF